MALLLARLRRAFVGAYVPPPSAQTVTYQGQTVTYLGVPITFVG